MKPDDRAIPAAEIEEALWASVLEPCDLALAPLTREVIFPLLRQQLLSR